MPRAPTFGDRVAKGNADPPECAGRASLAAPPVGPPRALLEGPPSDDVSEIDDADDAEVRSGGCRGFVYQGIVTSSDHSA